MSSVHDLYKHTINTLVILNGGASIAFLALYGDIFDDGVSSRFKLLFVAAEFLYFAGAVLALLGMKNFHDGIRIWTVIWEDVAIKQYSITKARRERGDKTAQEKIERSEGHIKDALFAFIAGTICVGTGLILL
jgi:hypothetical protein